MKNSAILLQQIGLKSLGFDPGPLDGVEGNKTRAAFNAWLITQDDGIPDNWIAIQITRWENATISQERLSEIRSITERVLHHRARYENVAAESRVPWFIIACLHNMESGGNFNCHLHEGSSLSARTKYVPRGRPRAGNPPFTWEQSALDALAYDNLAAVNWSSLGHLLYACERYNGLGYLKYHPPTPSPYLWAATSEERSGKYTSDGNWSATARSKQVGIVAILKSLESSGQIEMPR